jgi:hypothetical protein
LEHGAERASIIISASAHPVNAASVLTVCYTFLTVQQRDQRPASITIATGVEILLNCVWLVLGLSLILAWSVHAWRERGCEPDRALPSRQLQFASLLLLLILLFPVISLTDDIAMSTAPQDAERALRLHDPFDGAQSAPALLPSAMAWVDVVSGMLRTGPSRPVEQDAKLTILLAGTLQSIDSRPPPISL